MFNTQKINGLTSQGREQGATRCVEFPTGNCDRKKVGFIACRQSYQSNKKKPPYIYDVRWKKCNASLRGSHWKMHWTFFEMGAPVRKSFSVYRMAYGNIFFELEDSCHDSYQDVLYTGTQLYACIYVCMYVCMS